MEHYQERGTTINSVLYSEMLTDRLKLEQTPKTTVERYSVAACCPNSLNPLEIQV
jgi:hypothetical protein